MDIARIVKTYQIAEKKINQPKNKFYSFYSNCKVLVNLTDLEHTIEKTYNELKIVIDTEISNITHNPNNTDTHLHLFAAIMCLQILTKAALKQKLDQITQKLLTEIFEATSVLLKCMLVPKETDLNFYVFGIKKVLKLDLQTRCRFMHFFKEVFDYRFLLDTLLVASSYEFERTEALASAHERKIQLLSTILPLLLQMLTADSQGNQLQQVLKLHNEISALIVQISLAYLISPQALENTGKEDLKGGFTKYDPDNDAYYTKQIKTLRKLMIIVLQNLVQASEGEKFSELKKPTLIEIFKIYQAHFEHFKNRNSSDELIYLQHEPIERVRFLVAISSIDRAIFAEIFFASEVGTTKSHLTEALLFNDSATRKLAASLLEILIEQEENYMRAKKITNESTIQLFDTMWRDFINIYKTLDSYPVHLLKAVFSHIKSIIEEVNTRTLYQLNKANFLYDARWPLSILVEKAYTHNNATITKHFVKSFLKLDIKLENYDEFLIERLTDILNSRFLYKDSDPLVDSKFTAHVVSFYKTLFDNVSPDLYEGYLKRFLSTIVTKDKFLINVIGLLEVFQHLANPKAFIDRTLFQDLIRFAKKEGIKFHIRKQNKFYNYVLTLFGNFTDVSKLTAADIYDFLECFFEGIFDVEYYPEEARALFHKAVFGKSEDAQKEIQALLKSEFNFKTKILAIFCLNSAISHQDLIHYPKSQLAKIFKNEETEFNVVGFFRYCSVLNTLRVSDIPEEFFPKLAALLEYKKELAHGHFLSKIFEPVVEQAQNLYRNPYQQPRQKEYTLKFLRKALAWSLREKEETFQNNVIQLIDLIASDLFAYIGMALKETAEKQDIDPDLADNLAGITRHVFQFAIKSQNVPFQCKLLGEIVNFTKELMTKHLLPILSQAKEISLHMLFTLQIFNEILASYVAEIKAVIKAGQAEIYTDDILFQHFFTIVKSLATNKYDRKALLYRNFLGQRQRLIMHYFSLVGFNPEIVRSEEYIESLELFNDLLTDQIDSIDFRSQLDLFEAFRIVYVPYILSKAQNNMAGSVKELAAMIERCTESLFQNELHDYHDVRALISFALDERLVLGLDSEHFIKIPSKLLDLGATRHSIVRYTTNQLFSAFLKNPKLTNEYMEIVVRLLTTNEYRGYEAHLYSNNDKDFIIEGNKTVNDDVQSMSRITHFHGAYPRFMMLILINSFTENAKAVLKDLDASAGNKAESLEQLKEAKNFLESLTMEVMKRLLKRDPTKMVMPYNDEHRRLLHLSHTLCTLNQFTKKDVYEAYKAHGIENNKLVEIKNTLWKLLDTVTLPTIRQYYEIYALNFILEFPELCVEDIKKHLINKNAKAQFSISIIFIIGYYIAKHPESKYSEHWFTYYFSYVSSNTAYIRAIAQFFSTRFLQSQEQIRESHIIMKEFYSYFLAISDRLGMLSKFETLIAGFKSILENFNLETLISTPFDEYGEVIHESVVEHLRDECVKMINKLRVEENPPPVKEEMWTWKLKDLLEEHQGPIFRYETEKKEMKAFQKKIEIEDEEMEGLVDLDAFSNMKKPDDVEIIVVATLLEKVPNFANLCRTCEIFGVKELVLPSLKLIDEEGFKNISVTSEKWLPLSEVREKDLGEYLKLKKLEGYTLLALEQTSESKTLQNYRFPGKFLLLLGNEREGVPTEFIQLMDEFIEIPQFGRIRSLNVHISAVISVWECVKQKRLGK